MSLARLVGVLLVLVLAAVTDQEVEAKNSQEGASRCYELGVQVRHRHDVQAASYFQCACDGGLAIGCYELAHMYHTGEGVAPDDAKAQHVYERICRAGRVEGCVDLARLQDPAKLVELLDRSCKLGQVYGCHNLGYMYDLGIGMAKDSLRASSLYRRAQALEEMRQQSEPPASSDPELDAAKEGAVLSRKIPGYDAWRRSFDLFGAEPEACVSTYYSGTYYVRVRKDGSVGAVLVRPKGEVGQCIERAMARLSVAPPPGGGDAWVASGVTISK